MCPRVWCVTSTCRKWKNDNTCVSETVIRIFTITCPRGIRAPRNDRGVNYRSRCFPIAYIAYGFDRCFTTIVHTSLMNWRAIRSVEGYFEYRETLEMTGSIRELVCNKNFVTTGNDVSVPRCLRVRQFFLCASMYIWQYSVLVCVFDSFIGAHKTPYSLIRRDSLNSSQV